MTSDAKIGLLLGLVFIFIIAFIINGLPNFREKTSNNELTENMINRPSGIGERERQANNKVIDPVKRFENHFNDSPIVNNEPKIRYEAPLPQNSLIVKQTEQPKLVTVQVADSVIVKKIENTQNSKTKIESKSYVVTDGDSLAAIAKKVYGKTEGNRQINIDKIYQANRELLKSPDEIYVGQKLIIPQLAASASAKSIFENTNFFKAVEAIGKRHIPSKPQESKSSNKSNTYIVSEGDNLWKIAAKKLGDGNRYLEIVQINADILSDEDDIPVGMQLKLPVN
jgi:nucleoid-associated protein YgaU